MAQLAPFFRTTFYKRNSLGYMVPVASGKLHTYISGTTTDKISYADQGQITQNNNPITLDADGSCDLWLSTSGAYTLLLNDSDDSTLIDQWDAVTAVPSSVSGSYLALSGGTLTGALFLAANATANLHAVPLQQANSLIATAIATEVTNRNTAIAAIALPSQTGNSGKTLTTNGSAASWATVASLIGGTVASAGSVSLGAALVKWGTTGTLALDSSGNAVTFAAAFPTACYGAVAVPVTDNGVSGAGGNYSWNCHTFTAAGFKINNDASASAFFYIAIGS